VTTASQAPSALPERLGLATTWFELPGLRIHAAVAGPVGGPLVLLLHGFPEFWYSFRHQIAPLAAAGFRVVAPDQRGYNLTGPRPPYDLPTLVADAGNLIAACGRQRAFVAGHDWGAAVAWQLAVTRPERVERLAILNVPHPAVMSAALRGGNWRQMRRSSYIFLFQLPWLPEWLLRRRDFARLRWLLRASSRPGTFTDEDVERYREAWARPGALPAMIGWYRAMRRTAAATAWAGSGRRVHPPTMVLWGERDAALGVELAEASMRLVDDGELIRFPEATHWVHEDLPEVITGHLLRHFRAGTAVPG
jgi:pimeloyl-ACP methyl ester carboxylesterase